MALSREEVLGITRYLQRTLSRIDPYAYGIAMELTEREEEPGRYLLNFLLILTKVYSERSAGAYPDILDRMNHFVRTSGGGRSKVSPSISRPRNANSTELRKSALRSFPIEPI